MTLSERVSKGPVKTTDGGGAARRGRGGNGNGPWGGMNVTTPPREHAAIQRRASDAEEKRASRYHKTGPQAAARAKGKEGFKALKMQQALSQVPYGQRARTKAALAELDSFDAFDLLPVVHASLRSQALPGLTDLSPTPIQRLAIPALLGTEDGKRRRRHPVPITDMQQFLLAAETGSGKTLAYLLPVIDALKRAEIAEAEHAAEAAMQQEAEAKRKAENNIYTVLAPDVDEPHPSTGRPRAIILLPTSELVAQVGALVKSLSHTVKFRSAMISASLTGTVIRSRLFNPGGIDLLISTPSLLSSITESDPNVLSRVSHLVIDEADSLFDRSFAPITSAILDRSTPSLRQLILCSATIPRSLDSYLHKRFPSLHRLATPNLHAIPRRVQLAVVDIDRAPYQGNRDLACAQTIWDIGLDETPDMATAEKAEKKMLIFVNERARAAPLAAFLRSKGIDATELSRDSDARQSAETLAAFTRTSARESTSAADPALEPYHPAGGNAPTPARHLPSTRVLVLTDLGSRGIDTLAVRHVLLYDVPHSSIDFIHRLGRVGRMGRRGKAWVLVGKHDRRDVVAEVREGMFMGRALI